MTNTLNLLGRRLSAQFRAPRGDQQGGAAGLGCPRIFDCVATSLGLAPNTLSSHFDRLRQAGLISARREGRSLI
jgi:DNA-binding transcriptional ArsR family regulator